MSDAPKTLSRDLANELAYNATGDEASDTNPAYSSRVIESNFRKSEALLSLHDHHPMQEVRTLFLRGQLAAARELLEKLESQELTSLEKVELALERARLFSYEGKWSEAKAACDAAIGMRPSSLTLMTLHSVRSVAHFELGHFDLALLDLDRVRSFSEIYPYSISRFYAENLKAKIFIRQNPESLVSLQEKLLASLQSLKKISADHLLTLLRTYADMAFVTKQSPVKYSSAAFLLADQMGDNLYRELSRVELATLSGDLSKVSGEYARVTQLIDGSKTTTAQALRRQFGSEPQAVFPEGTEKIFWIATGIVIDLKNLKISQFENHHRLFSAVQILSEGSLSKAKFFERVWNQKRYSPHLHDSLVRVLLSRLRKELGASVSSQNGTLSISGAIIL